MGRGVFKMVGGSENLPLQEVGKEKVLAMMKGDHKKLWGSFDTSA